MPGCAVRRRGNLDDLDRDEVRRELAEFLDLVHERLRTLADAVAAQHFWRSRPMLPLGPAVAVAS